MHSEGDKFLMVVNGVEHSVDPAVMKAWFITNHPNNTCTFCRNNNVVLCSKLEALNRMAVEGAAANNIALTTVGGVVKAVGINKLCNDLAPLDADLTNYPGFNQFKGWEAAKMPYNSLKLDINNLDELLNKMKQIKGL